MGDYGDDEHSGNVTPRRPTKGDYQNARRFRQELGLPCRLYLAGHRRRMTPGEWRRALHGKGVVR